MEAEKKIQDELFRSIRQHNIDRVKEILSGYPELANAEQVQVSFLGASTPLMQACHSGKCLVFVKQ